MSEQFEERLLGVLSTEIQSSPEGPHLEERELRRLLSGRTRIGEFERLGGHLASCTECRARYDAARRTLGAAPRAIGGGSAPWVGRILLRHVGVVAIVFSVVVLSLALSESPGSTSSNGRSVAPTARGAAIAQPESLRVTSALLDPQSLVRALHVFDGYPPSRAAAYTIGLLRQYGVPLTSASLAFDAATVYVTESGDTWQSVAATSLGDAALWPMVVLLNLELSKDGEFVPPGTYLHVPKTLPPGGPI